MEFLSRYESLNPWVRLLCGAVDLVGGVVFAPWRALRPPLPYDPGKIDKIVIFRLDGLGDVVLSTAALREIRRGFPRARITLVVGPWAADIIKNCSFFDELVVYDSFLFRFFRGGRSFDWRGEYRLIKKLRRRAFDLGVDLRGDLLSIIPMWFSGCRYRFAAATRGGAFLLTHVVPYDHRATPSQQSKNLQVVKALQLPVGDSGLELEISPAAQKAVKTMFEKKKPDDGKIICLAPCSLYDRRSWPAEKFAALGERLVRERGETVFLIGSQRQRPRLDEIASLASGKLINTAGELSLPEVAALLKKAALCVGNDSGIMHVAAALKCPIIQLFGPGPAETFGHFYPGSALLQYKDCPHFPCTQRECSNKGDWCMDKISLDEVWREVERLLPR